MQACCSELILPLRLSALNLFFFHSEKKYTTLTGAEVEDPTLHFGPAACNRAPEIFLEWLVHHSGAKAHFTHVLRTMSDQNMSGTWFHVRDRRLRL